MAATDVTPVKDIVVQPNRDSETSPPDDTSMTGTLTTLRSIFSIQAISSNDAGALVTDPDGTKYSVRKLNAVRIINRTRCVSPRNGDGLIDGGSNNGLAGGEMLLAELNVNEVVDVIGCTDGVVETDLPVGTLRSIVTADNGEKLVGNFRSHNVKRLVCVCTIDQQSLVARNLYIHLMGICSS